MFETSITENGRERSSILQNETEIISKSTQLVNVEILSIKGLSRALMKSCNSVYREDNKCVFMLYF